MKRVAYASAMLSVTLLQTSSAAGASIAKKEAGKQYLKDVAPLNAQITKFNAESDKWTSSTTDAQGGKGSDSAHCGVADAPEQTPQPIMAIEGQARRPSSLQRNFLTRSRPAHHRYDFRSRLRKLGVEVCQ